jgi:UDP-2-acetamido-3-amino-2,3-dideoxy-glucuronate N-acetyltransferase
MEEYKVYPSSDVQTSNIVFATTIWQFYVILPCATIGRDCICANVFIENKVFIGDRVTNKNGVQIWNGFTISDDIFIGPNVTFTNDRYSRSKEWQNMPSGIVVEAGASIGANAAILPGVRIGKGAIVGAGSAVTKDMRQGSFFAGNPAVLKRYISEDK